MNASASEAATQESVSVSHRHVGADGIVATSPLVTPRQLSAGANESNIQTDVVTDCCALAMNQCAVTVGSGTGKDTVFAVFVESEAVEEGCDEETEAKIDDHN